MRMTTCWMSLSDDPAGHVSCAEAISRSSPYEWRGPASCDPNTPAPAPSAAPKRPRREMRSIESWEYVSPAAIRPPLKSAAAERERRKSRFPVGYGFATGRKITALGRFLVGLGGHNTNHSATIIGPIIGLD